MQIHNSMPNWYVGPEGILKRTLERANAESAKPYQRYTGTRIAPFSPLQNSAFTSAQDDFANPMYRNLADRINPALDRAFQNPLENVNQYMNPYQNAVVENIGTMASRNLTENILPNVRDRFIRSGQYGSTGHERLTNRAIRDTQEGVNRAQSEALQGGFNSALNAASEQQSRNMRMAEAMPGISSQLRAGNQSGADQMFRMGTAQQARDQDILNRAEHDFMEERDYEAAQASRMADILQGTPTPLTPYRAPYQAQSPSASIYSQLGGHMMNMYGQSQQPRFAKGGLVKNIQRFAQGGMPDPLQAGIQDAQETNQQNMINRSQLNSAQMMRQQDPNQQQMQPNYMQGEYGEDLSSIQEMANRLKTPDRDPFWSAFSKMGLKMAARRKAGDFMGDLGEAANAAHDEYHAERRHQEGRRMQGVNLEGMIGKTHRAVAEVKRKEAFDNLVHKDRLGIQNAELGLRREELGLKRDDMNFSRALDREKLDMPRADNATKTLEKTNKKSATLFDKANEKEVERIQESFRNLPSLKTNLKELGDVASKLDTGAIRGGIASKNATLGALSGIGKAEDVNKFSSLTSQLVLDLGNQLKGSTVALGKLKMIEQTKPELGKEKEANLSIVKHMQDLIKMVEDKDKFVLKSIRSGHDAVDAERAYNTYLDAREEFRPEKKTDKFLPTPDDFLDTEFEEMTRVAPSKSGNSSDEEIPLDVLLRKAQ